ncbi:MAG: sugar ABC transporter substrate-binding protein [Ruminococcus sp.]|jgi:inositol transport system substrate-binding protein
MKRKTLKKAAAWILSLVMACGIMTGCSSSSGESETGSGSESEESGEEKETYTIGFTNRLASDVFLKTLEDKFVEACEADGRFEVVLADANNDSQKQVEQVDNFLVMGVDALVLCPNDEASLVPQIEQANAAGIPVFTFSTQAAGGEQTYVGVSNYECGYSQGEWLKENLPENAKMIYLAGNMGYQISSDRQEGLLEGLGDRLADNGGDVEIIAQQEYMYTREEGMTIMEDYIQAYDDFDCVVAVNDQGACGAIEALKAANRLDGVMVCGIDAIDDALTYIKSGEMAMTVRQDPDAQAEALYQAICDTFDGKEVEEVIETPVQTVTAENVDEFLSE